MNTIIKQSLILTGIFLILFAVVYPLMIFGIGLASPGKGSGVKIESRGRVVGYGNIGQKFISDKYFNGRPSAIDYNAAGSAGSNKGPTNPDYLKVVQERIDTFLVHNPDVKKQDIPADLVTASGSGLDPQISFKSALIQVDRICKIRKISKEELESLVRQNLESPVLGIFGTSSVNVLKLNIALDVMSEK
jgi:K+-transporting ATPase ATPase C chain